MTARVHYVVVKIECLDPQGSRQAAARVKAWLETFGHTAPSHGFEFVEVSSNLREAMTEEQGP